MDELEDTSSSGRTFVERSIEVLTERQAREGKISRMGFWQAGSPPLKTNDNVITSLQVLTVAISVSVLQ